MVGGRTAGTALAVLALIAGCAPSRSSSSSSRAASTAPASTAQTQNTNAPATTFQVIGFDPASGPAASVTALTITFSAPVDPSWLIFGTTWLAAEDTDATPGGDYTVLGGSLSLDATGTVLTYTPEHPFTPGHEVRFVLAANVKDTGGDQLQTSATSSTLGFESAIQNEVFEGSFMPQ